MLIFVMIACMQKELSPKLTKRIGTDFSKTIVQSSDYTLFRWNDELQEPKKLGPGKQLRIQKFLRNSNNYVFGANVRCRLRPNHALVMKNKGNSYRILLENNNNCPKLKFVSPTEKTVVSLRPKAWKNLQKLLP